MQGKSSIRRTLAPDGYTRFMFPNNRIPTSRVDPVALKIQSFLPAAGNALQSNNFALSGTSPRPQNLPSIKLDHNVSPSLKLSTYYSYVGGSGQTSTDGLPVNITTAGLNTSAASTARVNIDKTVSPSTLLHLGVGYVNAQVTKFQFPEVDTFDQVAQLGLTGAITQGFPQISGLGNTSASGAPIGGMRNNVGATYPSSSEHRRIHLFGVAELGERVAHLQIRRQHAYPYGRVYPMPGRVGSLCILRRPDRTALRRRRCDADHHQRKPRAELCQFPSRVAEHRVGVALRQFELARPGDCRIRSGQLESYEKADPRLGPALRFAESADRRPEPDQLVLPDSAESERRRSAGCRALPRFRSGHVQLRQYLCTL